MDPADFQGFHPKVFADTVVDMDDIIPRLDFPEMGNAVSLVRCPNRLALLMTKDILFRHHDEPGRSHFKTGHQRTLLDVD